MPTIRTTMRPDEEIVVSDAEYERLLEIGVIYDGTPPVEPADAFDLRMAARIVDTDSSARDALDALYGGGSSGAVDSVNGQTGVVVLDADDIADGTTGKILTATERTKLSGIATGATANSSDATLLARANHTGTQATSTVTGLDTALAGKANSTHTHVATTDLTATGTKDSTTFLRGDNTWAVPAGGGGGWSAVDASETVKGIVELATTAEATTGTDTVRAVTPAGVKAVGDTKVATGDARVTADQAAATASIRTLGTGALQAAAGNHTHTGLSAASETASGIVELATAAETTTGTDNTRAVHPAGLKVELDKKAPLTGVEGIKVHDLTAGGGTRPTGYARVRWVGGTVRPTNMVTGDIWEHDA